MSGLGGSQEALWEYLVLEQEVDEEGVVEVYSVNLKRCEGKWSGLWKKPYKTQIGYQRT